MHAIRGRLGDDAHDALLYGTTGVLKRYVYGCGRARVGRDYKHVYYKHVYAINQAHAMTQMAAANVRLKRGARYTRKGRVYP